MFSFLSILCVRGWVVWSIDNDDEGKEGIDELTAPEFLLTLQATDEFIKERTMNLPEAAIADTKNSEERK
jgi:hypothetical protein